ncbi:PEGA domain-containing protein [Polyangium fumosum]
MPRHRGGKLRSSLDGRHDAGGRTDTFVAPGEHELRARLDGYEDAVETFTARKGQEMRVTLTLRALPEPLPPPLKLRRESPRKPHLRARGPGEPPLRWSGIGSLRNFISPH